MNTLRQSYEQLAYSFGLHWQVNIDHLHAVARFLGHPAVHPERARVLEIGCGAAPDLLGMAASFPQATFHGIDFAGSAIQLGQEIAEEAGLTNLTLAQADLLDWVPPDEPFDYVIAHGFFSWVPDPVKEALLGLLGRILAPGGIGFVSYAAYPGSKQDDALRDLLLMHTEGLSEAEEKTNAAYGVLDFLDRAWGSTTKLEVAGSLRASARRIRNKPTSFLAHDDLGEIRDPCYLLQFVDWAHEFGLSYLGDAEPHTMFLENLPAQTAAELAAMKLPQADTEQMIDYIVHRTFRSSLLVKGTGHGAVLTPQALEDLALSTLLRPAKKGGKQRKKGGPSVFTGPQITKVEIANPITAGFLEILAGHSPDFTPFATLRSEFEQNREQALSDDELHVLLNDLATLITRRTITMLSMAHRTPPPNDPQPALSVLNRILARRFGLLRTAAHQSVQLTDAQRALCLLIDGTRSLTQLKTTPEGRELGEKFLPFLAFLRDGHCFETPPMVSI